MATVLAVARGPYLILWDERTREIRRATWADEPEEGGRRRAGLLPEDLPAQWVQWATEVPATVPLLGANPAFAEALSRRLGRKVGIADLRALRRVRADLPALDPRVERAFLRALASQELARTLRSPEEVLITLAREEERLERAVGREERASESFLALPGSRLETYAEGWKAARSVLATHHVRLVSLLESEARVVLPNLSKVVGPRSAARLLAAAGGLAALGRASAPRLQLLGSRRRPSAEHGPRYGVLFRADRMGDVPLGRRGAYARSLAALAVIAARADVTTHRDIAGALVARRDRRVDQLRRRRP